MHQFLKTISRHFVAGFLALGGIGFASTAATAVEPIFAHPPAFDSIWAGVCDPEIGGPGPLGSNGCADHQFIAAAVSVGGLVVGYDIAQPAANGNGSPSNSYYKRAAIWVPDLDSGSPSFGPHDFYYLNDTPSDFANASNIWGFGFSQFIALSSWAKDVNHAGTAIVGSALVNGCPEYIDGETSCSTDRAISYGSHTFYVPLLWTGSLPSGAGPGAGYDVTALPVLTGECVNGSSCNDLFQGGARGITSHETVTDATIVGWSGNVKCKYGWCNGADAGAARYEFIEAVRWQYGLLTNGISGEGWHVEKLNVDPDGDGDLTEAEGRWGDDSVANRSDDSGNVIGGWIGDAKTFYKAFEFAGDRDFKAEPFIWTPSNGMQVLPLLTVTTTINANADEEPTTFEHNVGNVHDVSGDGTMAVGWSGCKKNEYCDKPELPKGLGGETAGDYGAVPYQAVYWQSLNGWATLPAATALGTVDLTDVPMPVMVNALPEEIPLVVRGTVANAVDQHGDTVVGQIDLTEQVTCKTGVCAKAGDYYDDYYTSRAVIWEAANGYAGQLIQVLLASEGINLGNYIMTTATGVHTVYDSNGVATDVLITGNGEFYGEGDEKGAGVGITDPAWLVRLGRITGITTPPDQVETFGTISSLLDLVGGQPQLAGLGDVAQNQLCIRPNGEAGEGAIMPWCFFAFGTGTWFIDSPDGAQFVGDVGIARFLTGVDSVALSAGASHLNVNLGSNAASLDSTGYHVSAYAAHMPDSGVQATISGTYAWYTDVNITRRYANGTGTAQSVGSTDGYGYGFAGWLGYAMPLNAQHTLTPFVQLSYSSNTFNGWSETGGPFPATFGTVTGESTDLRLGIKDDWKVTAITTIFGSAAWVHRLSGGAPTVNGSLQIAGCNTATPLTAFCNLLVAGASGPDDMFEGTVGAKVQITPDSMTSASVTVNAGDGGFLAVSGRLGYSKSF